MRWAFLLIHDRPEYKERSLASAKANLPEPDEFIEVDDTAHELGFAGAIDKGWREAAKKGVDYLFHCEGDFLFNEEVPLERMAWVLNRNPYLGQMSLKRQAWNEQEVAAGGIVELDPDSFLQRTEHGDVWTEHRAYWTTNPSLMPIGFTYQGWPLVEHSEGVFFHRLVQGPEVHFGIWGGKFDPPRIHHIGDVRAGKGY